MPRVDDRPWLARDADDPDFWSFAVDERELPVGDGGDPDQFRALYGAPADGARGGLAVAAAARLERGPGFVILRGFPLHGGSEIVRQRFWSFCRSLGTPLPQTRERDHLMAVAHDATAARQQIGRWYGSRERLTFHTDRCDVLALLVVRPAEAGGITKIASSVAIHDAMARERPDLLALLHRDLSWRVPELPVPGQAPFFRQPVFSVEGGRLSCCYNRFQIEAGHRYPGAHPLQPMEREALDLFETLAEDPQFHFSLRLEPGDLQLVNNHVVLHARTAYQDSADSGRLLLRSWLAVADSRPLAPERAATFGDCRPGRIRGFYFDERARG
ncbi:hypothetical protein STAQ_49980 [Allostella sp. ATCC 35155]|nr:hypothetical protein STAQ_49980 [Stella sp. ATCC 35155]